jgi:hypothetical protein
MWTARSANRFSFVFGMATVALLVAAAVGAGLRGKWGGVTATAIGAVLVVVFMVVVGRSRRESAVLAAGLARDERQAYLQLRAYATVGQAFLVLFVGLLAFDLIRGVSGPWGWLLGFGGLVGSVTLFISRELEKSA